MKKRYPERQKKRKSGTVAGVNFTVNEFGEIKHNLDINELNTHLNRNLKDRKLEKTGKQIRGKDQPFARPLRVLIAKCGLDGHDRGAKVIASSLRDEGMEVIYTGLRQTPEMVITAALQEDVDVIGISVLSGAHRMIFKRITDLMKKNKMHDVLLTGGGVVPDEDIVYLEKLGVGKIFTPGTHTREIAGYIRNWVKTNRKF